MTSERFRYSVAEEGGGGIDVAVNTMSRPGSGPTLISNQDNDKIIMMMKR